MLSVRSCTKSRSRRGACSLQSKNTSRRTLATDYHRSARIKHQDAPFRAFPCHSVANQLNALPCNGGCPMRRILLIALVAPSLLLAQRGRGGGTEPMSIEATADRVFA